MTQVAVSTPLALLGDSVTVLLNSNACSANPHAAGVSFTISHCSTGCLIGLQHWTRAKAVVALVH